MHKLLFSLVALGLTSTASAGFVDPFVNGAGYWDQSTARLWFSVSGFITGDVNSWDTFASMFNPVTGEANGCANRDGCDIWASSSEVEQVFGDIGGQYEGGIFRAFGATFPGNEGYDCPAFAGWISAGLTRDHYLVVSNMLESPCGTAVQGAFTGSFFEPAPDFGDPSFGAFVYEQFAVPESETGALMIGGLLFLLWRRRNQPNRITAFPTAPQPTGAPRAPEGCRDA